SVAEADMIDQALIAAEYYTEPLLKNCIQQSSELPTELLHLLQQLFSLEYLAPADFLPLQNLMHSLDEFCFSAEQFLHPASYRIMSLTFEERFNLHELNGHVHDIELLFRHALEHRNMLGFARLMNREAWQRDDLLCKTHFLESHHHLWQKKVAKLPLFDCS